MKLSKQEMQKIISTLKNVFYKYQSKGLISIYLWGSVLSNDYIPNKSDIDSVGLVEDNASEEDVEIIRNKFLSEEKTGLKNFKINYVYLSEMNTGKIKSKIASQMHPSIILLDFQNWKYVVGKKFARKDFKLKEVSFDKAITLEIEELKRRHLPKLASGDYDSTEYFCKYLMKINHFLNQKENGKHNFSYKELLKHTPESRKDIVKTLLKIRTSGWNQNLLKKELNKLLDFLHQLEN